MLGQLRSNDILPFESFNVNNPTVPLANRTIMYGKHMSHDLTPPPISRAT